MPLLDIEETDGRWIVEAELPGVNRKDVSVEICACELVITGEMQERERRGIERRGARPTPTFEYRVTLPGPIDDERVEGTMADGVLSIEVSNGAR
jgi:HSP20 family protein